MNHRPHSRAARAAIVLMLTLLSFGTASAQQLKFGYLNFSEAIKQMPEYAQVQADMADLRAKYDAEMKRSEEEFNKKYEEFLEGQHDFAPSIFQKRQAELMDMMDKNIAFKNEARRLLRQAEQNARQPLKDRLRSILDQIGKERGYAFILNTDGDALPFVNPEQGEDLTLTVQEIIGN